MDKIPQMIKDIDEILTPEFRQKEQFRYSRLVLAKVHLRKALDGEPLYPKRPQIEGKVTTEEIDQALKDYSEHNESY